MIDLHAAVTSVLALTVMLVCVTIGLYWTAGGLAVLLATALYLATSP